MHDGRELRQLELAWLGLGLELGLGLGLARGLELGLGLEVGLSLRSMATANSEMISPAIEKQMYR